MHIYTLFVVQVRKIIQLYFLTLCLKAFKLFSFLIKSINCSMWRSQYKTFCLSHVSFAKCIFTFTKFISSAHATMLGKFKNLIRIIRTSVIDKIKGYGIYALVNPFTGR